MILSAIWAGVTLETRTVGRWNAGMLEWWNGGTVERRNGGRNTPLNPKTRNEDYTLWNIDISTIRAVKMFPEKYNVSQIFGYKISRHNDEFK